MSALPAGASQVPLQCADLAPAVLLADGLTVAPEREFFLSSASLVNGGLLSCDFDAGEGGVSLLVHVLADVAPSWVEGFVDPTVSDGIVEARYCFDDIELARHCGVRLGLEHYGAEIFFNADTPGAIAPVIDEAVASIGGALAALPEPSVPSESPGGPLSLPTSCADIDLASSPAAGELPGLARDSMEVGWDDAPHLVLIALQRSGGVTCEWGDLLARGAWEGRLVVDVVPAAAWALSRLPGGVEIAVPGADRAHLLPFRDETGWDVQLVVVVGDDVLGISFDDPESVGAADPDVTAEAVMIASSVVQTLTSGAPR